MAKEIFVWRSRIEAPAEAVFRWHAAPGALERLLPPWERVDILERPAGGGIREGDRVVLRVATGPVCRNWVAEHRGVEEGRRFQDVQVEGPFSEWIHTHSMIPDGSDACFLEDRIDYALPLGAVGAVFGRGFVKRKLTATFAYRHRVIRDDLSAHRRFADRGPFTVLVSGSTGLVGTQLAPFLTTGGHTVIPLVREPTGEDRREAVWDPARGRLDPAALEGIDAVVHLAGENIASARWTEAQKARIRDSRVIGTRLLAETLARLDRPPRVLVSASAVGYYGDRGDEPLTEVSEPGLGFLPDVCRVWEAATAPAEARGIRVVHLRIGVVLSRRGGALKTMLPVFRVGLGGKLGTGRQYLSWIHINDLVGAVHHAIMSESLTGPVNATAPAPVTNLAFTKTVGRVLLRPTVAPLPATPARALLGEMADALLLEGCKALPEKLEQSGFRFRHAQLEDALRVELGRLA